MKHFFWRLPCAVLFAVMTCIAFAGAAHACDVCDLTQGACVEDPRSHSRCTFDGGTCYFSQCRDSPMALGGACAAQLKAVELSTTRSGTLVMPLWLGNSPLSIVTLKSDKTDLVRELRIHNTSARRIAGLRVGILLVSRTEKEPELWLSEE